MRIPLARYGRKEIVLFGGVAAVLVVLCPLLGALWLAPLPALFLLFVLYFFRDPERRIPEGDGVVVAPADGKVIGITDVEDEEHIGGPAKRIDIFLAVYNVHVNRAPLAGEVDFLADRDGYYHSAFKPDAAGGNKARLVGFTAARGGFPFLVRQIVGSVARRIVSPVKEGDRLARGERFGMIKFGSRTALSIPADVPFDVKVKIGDRVRGGASVLGVIREVEGE
ncbi:MAG: phosphatidylserine decarboxylase [Planctomycetota bacterium]|jgi:phosphatidylserine decarboxylase